MKGTRSFLTLGFALALIGCDPNPNGPTAPAPPSSPAPPAPTPADDDPPGKGKNQTLPLRKVGQPIGVLVLPGPASSLR
jgi:hypothetical protein